MKLIRGVLWVSFIFSFSESTFATEYPVLTLNSDSINDDFLNHYEVYLGKRIYRTSFYDQIATFDNPGDVFTPVSFIGIGTHTRFLVGRRIPYYGHINVLSWYFPQNIKIDSLNCRLKGFQSSISLYGVNVIPARKKADLMFSVGISGGRLKLKEKGEWAMKNGYFAPMASMCFHLEFKMMHVGFNAYYDHDITSSKWKKTLIRKEAPFAINNFNQSALTAYIFFWFNIW